MVAEIGMCQEVGGHRGGVDGVQLAGHDNDVGGALPGAAMLVEAQ
jgi:hypothetical protein